MRHIKARKRFKLILKMLFIICLVLFFESRIEAFAPQVKNFAILKIEDTFSGKLKLSIGSLDGGILHPFVLNDIKIKDKKGALLFSSLDISSIRTNYRIWDVLLKAKDSSVLSQVLARDSRVYINFVTKDGRASGFVRLDGDLANSGLKGYVNFAGMNRIDFDGNVKQDRFALDVKLDNGSVNAKGSISEDGELKVDLKINHIKLCGADIDCDATLKNRIVNAGNSSGKNYVEGELDATKVMVNYNPFLDFKVSYRIEDGVLHILDLNLGDSFDSQGKINLKSPFIMDFTILANNLNLSRFFSQVGAKDAGSVLSGTVNAKCELKGAANNLKSIVHLEIRKGTIATLDFDYLNATLKGDGPIVRIEESRITRESGYFAIAGEMDLRKMGKNTLFENIKLSSDDRAITWDGWNTKKVQDVQEFNMKKKINDDIDLNFKKFIAEEKVDESMRETDEVQVEYKLHPNNSLRMMVGQKKDFFGFEHKDKF